MAESRSDESFMRAALRAGRRGLGRTSPNPPVGAVVVRKGEIVGTGFHNKAGEPHAEREALRRAGPAARGGTVYVTLEPCNHHGRTPPCTEGLLDAGVQRVVIGTTDPNASVRGGGAARLRRAGIAVTTGILRAACDELIAFWRKHNATGKPFVTLKLAATLDGRIATASGESRWITAEASRRYVHELRNRYDAVLVGAGTALADDPALTCRARGGRNPVRVVLDGRLRLRTSLQLVKTAEVIPTLVVTGRSAPLRRVEALQRAGVEVVQSADRAGELSWARVLTLLGKRDLASVLVEGGAATASSLLVARAVDRLHLFLAPKLIGGDGRPLLDSLGVKGMRDVLRLAAPEVRRFGDDILLTADLRAQRNGRG